MQTDTVQCLAISPVILTKIRGQP